MSAIFRSDAIDEDLVILHMSRDPIHSLVQSENPEITNSWDEYGDSLLSDTGHNKYQHESYLTNYGIPTI